MKFRVVDSLSSVFTLWTNKFCKDFFQNKNQCSTSSFEFIFRLDSRKELSTSSMVSDPQLVPPFPSTWI